MKKFLFLFLFISFVQVFVVAQVETSVTKSEIIENIDGKDYYLHFVKTGETLFEIAKVYKITVNDIFNTNPESRNGIKSGQILRIPVKVSSKPKPGDKGTTGNYFFHIVKSKETLFSISRQYGVTIDEIEKINPEVSEYLKEGQTLKIPVREKNKIEEEQSFSENTVSHMILPGETLYAIAKQYNVTIGEILNANPGLTEKLKVGQDILIPNQKGVSETGQETVVTSQEPQITIHTASLGETIYLLAKTYGCSIDSIRAYNKGIGEEFFSGQEIKIPGYKRTEPYITHTAEKKDKLQKIANKYEIDFYELLALNPGIHNKINSGQTLRIPVKIVEGENSELIEEKVPENWELRQPCENIEENMSRLYNVALMLPLYLEEVDSIQYSETMDLADLQGIVSFRFIQFYEGFLMAVDSMQDAGMNLNLFVYDVDNSPEKINKVLRSSELSSMDLIIGPFFSKSFQKAADFAKTYHIKIVNPLSIREEVIHNNPYVLKVEPAMSLQTDRVIDFIRKYYSEDNIVIIRNNKYKYQADVSYIRNSLNSERLSKITIPNKKILNSLFPDYNKSSDDGIHKRITENTLFDAKELARSINENSSLNNMVREVIYVEDSTVGLNMNLSRIRNNFVILLSDETVFSQEVVSKLNKLSDKHPITLFGLPEWYKFDHLETSHMLNLNLHYLTPKYIDFNDIRVKEWIQGFRNKYKTEPGLTKFAFDGFDIGWYFLNALFLHGNSFEDCLDDFDIPLIQTRYNFENSPGNGYQNTNWIIGEYKNFSFIKSKN
ncbi:MAG: LysM peptidoglycan-binding domain-containing protein [Bacteroidales bacterium]